MRAVSRRLWVLIMVGALNALTYAQTGKSIAQKCMPSVVLLQMEDQYGRPTGVGSGFFVREDIIATCYHVIKGAHRGTVKLVGRDTLMTIVGVVAVDVQRDLALLKVSGKGLPLPIAPGAEVGEEVFALGNPLGLEGSLSQGIVSAVRREGAFALYQITAPISPGNSGGPVVNSHGQVIGVAMATIREGQNLNFAIASMHLQALINEIGEPSSLSSLQSTDSDTKNKIYKIKYSVKKGNIYEYKYYEYKYSVYTLYEGKVVISAYYNQIQRVVEIKNDIIIAEFRNIEIIIKGDGKEERLPAPPPQIVKLRTNGEPEDGSISFGLLVFPDKPVRVGDKWSRTAFDEDGKPTAVGNFELKNAEIMKGTEFLTIEYTWKQINSENQSITEKGVCIIYAETGIILYYEKEISGLTIEGVPKPVNIKYKIEQISQDVS